jgi:hypothetical protein
MQGINQLQSPDCWTWVNSKGSESINAVGAAQGSAQGFCTQGEVVGADQFKPSPYSGCSPMEAPSKDKITPPPSATCNYTNKRLNNGLHVLNPGVYCGGLELKPQAIADMLPGVSVIKDSRLNIQAQSHLIGEDVVFYFTGTGTGIDVHGGGEMTLRGCKAGNSYEGFLFIQDETSNVSRSTSRAAVPSRWKASSTRRPGRLRSAATGKSTRPLNSG